MTLTIPSEFEDALRRAAVEAGFDDVSQYALAQLVGSKVNVESQASRQGGQWKGQVVIADDFDDLPGDLQDAFEMMNTRGNTT